MRLFILLAMLSGTAAPAQEPAAEEPAQDAPAAEPDISAEADEGESRTTLGMSILGNEEAPKSLVIVPWKSSRIGDGLGVTNSMDDRARPVDREVFMREIRYYELRSGGSE